MVLITGAAAAEDGVVMVTGVVECVPATVVGACISAWHAGVTGVWGVTVEFLVSSRVLSPVRPLMAYLSWSLSLSRAWSILVPRSVS